MSLLIASLRRLGRQPAFLVVVVLMAVSAASLNAAVNFMKVYFKKEPVELRRPLTSIPRDVGTWRQITRDQAIDPEIEDVLGTDEYIFRTYVNEAAVGAERIAALRDENRTDAERLSVLRDVAREYPDAVINLAVTYYTGLVDTVPHVPDRCVVADGYEPKPSDNASPTWPVLDGGAEGLEVRFVNFEDQTGADRAPRSIAYVFHVNGQYVASPLGVRAMLQDLFERHAYYAKVEVMTTLSDQARSAAVLSDFLTAALPEVERALPDWQQVKSAAAGGAVAAATTER